MDIKKLKEFFVYMARMMNYNFLFNREEYLHLGKGYYVEQAWVNYHNTRMPDELYNIILNVVESRPDFLEHLLWARR